MKIITISGVWGSGKTTLIRELIARFAARGQRSAVIVNEMGEEVFPKDQEAELYQIHGG